MKGICLAARRQLLVFPVLINTKKVFNENFLMSSKVQQTISTRNLNSNPKKILKILSRGISFFLSNNSFKKLPLSQFFTVVRFKSA